MYEISFGDTVSKTFTVESINFKDVVTYISLDDLKTIIEDYCKKVYKEHSCEMLSKKLQTEIKQGALDLLSKYTVDPVLATTWSVDIAPNRNGFRINVYGYKGGFNTNSDYQMLSLSV